jgi:hypothetical protein
VEGRGRRAFENAPFVSPLFVVAAPCGCCNKREPKKSNNEKKKKKHTKLHQEQQQ